MTTHPPIAPGEWITVGNTDCVVTAIFKPESPSGACQVVFNKKSQPSIMSTGMEQSGSFLKDQTTEATEEMGIYLLRF